MTKLRREKVYTKCGVSKKIIQIEKLLNDDGQKVKRFDNAMFDGAPLVQEIFLDKEKGMNKDLIKAPVDELGYDGGFGFGGEGFTPAKGSAKFYGHVTEAAETYHA